MSDDECENGGSMRGIYLIICFMLLGGVILSCDFDESLLKYKAISITSIECYSQEDDYTPEDWELLLEIVLKGKSEIEGATNKLIVDTVVNTTKQLIDEIVKKENRMDKGLISSSNCIEETLPVVMAFISEKSKIKVGDDLMIKLYYGTLVNLPTRENNSTLVDTSVKMFMSQYVYGTLDTSGGSYAEELIINNIYKEFNDFSTQNYPVAGYNDIPMIYEIITIKANWFIGERGYIRWAIKTLVIWEEGSENSGGFIDLFYRVEGEDILLYSNYYNFFNGIQY